MLILENDVSRTWIGVGIILVTTGTARDGSQRREGRPHDPFARYELIALTESVLGAAWLLASGGIGRFGLV